MSFQFLSLPLELQLHVLGYLLPSELAKNISRVSKQLNQMAESDSVWKNYLKKRCQKGKYRPFKAAFVQHLEMIREEYLHPWEKELVNILEEDLPNEIKVTALMNRALKSSTYSICIFSHQCFLNAILKDPIARILIGHVAKTFKESALYVFQTQRLIDIVIEIEPFLIITIAESFEETALYFLQSSKLMEFAVKHYHGAQWLIRLATSFQGAALYFLQNWKLIDILMEKNNFDPTGILRIVSLFKEAILYFLESHELVEFTIKNYNSDPVWFKSIACSSKKAARCFLKNTQLTEFMINIAPDKSWIEQIRQVANESLDASNTEAHASAMPGP